MEFRVRPCSKIHEYGYSGPVESHLSLREYFARESSQSVIFENDFHAAHRALRGTYAIPGLLADVHGRPIFSAGRKHTGIGFHCHTENWLAQLHGRKAWFLLPDSLESPPTWPPWWCLRERPEGMLFGILEPGEVLFVPDYWWHATWNLDDVTIALGWEAEGSGAWGHEMHSIADGDVGKLRSLGYLGARSAAPDMLVLAARSGDAALMRDLLDDGGSAALTPEICAHAGVAAARGGHVDVLEFLSAQGCHATVPTRERQAKQTTALHEAVCCGQQKAVEWLLERGADARAQDRMGLEPLHLASLHGQTAVASALLAAKADPGARHRLGSTAMSQAAFNGHASVIELVLGVRAPVDVQDELGMTALHQASMRGFSAAVRRLLEAGAAVEACDRWRRTSLHVAASGYADEDDSAVPDVGFPTTTDANLEVVALLLTARADAGALDFQGCSARVLAEAAGHAGVVELLDLRSDRQ